MQPSHHWSEDVAALRLEVHGPSEQAVFAQAFTALQELFGAEAGNGEPVQRRVEAEADDHRSLLAEWLSELVFLVEKERLLLDEVAGVRVLDGQLEATVRGHRGDPPPGAGRRGAPPGAPRRTASRASPTTTSSCIGIAAAGAPAWSSTPEPARGGAPVRRRPARAGDRPARAPRRASVAWRSGDR